MEAPLVRPGYETPSLSQNGRADLRGIKVAIPQEAKRGGRSSPIILISDEINLVVTYGKLQRAAKNSSTRLRQQR